MMSTRQWQQKTRAASVIQGEEVDMMSYLAVGIDPWRDGYTIGLGDAFSAC